jgi:hypothetical protein
LRDISAIGVHMVLPTRLHSSVSATCTTVTSKMLPPCCGAQAHTISQASIIPHLEDSIIVSNGSSVSRLEMHVKSERDVCGVMTVECIFWKSDVRAWLDPFGVG